MQIIQKHNLVAPLNMVVLARISLFARVAIKGTSYVKQLIVVADSSNGSWLAAVQADICFVAGLKHFKESKLAALILGPPESLASANVVHSCSECGCGFRSKQQKAVHEFKKHGIRPPLHYKVAGKSCNACLLNFTNRKGLWNHVSGRSPDCRKWYSIHGGFFPTDEVDAEVEADRIVTLANIRKGKTRFAANCPVGRLEGPRPFGAKSDRKAGQQHRYYT